MGPSRSSVQGFSMNSAELIVGSYSAYPSLHPSPYVYPYSSSGDPTPIRQPQTQDEVRPMGAPLRIYVPQILIQGLQGSPRKPTQLRQLSSNWRALSLPPSLLQGLDVCHLLPSCSSFSGASAPPHALSVPPRALQRPETPEHPPALRVPPTRLPYPQQAAWVRVFCAVGLVVRGSRWILALLWLVWREQRRWPVRCRSCRLVVLPVGRQVMLR